MMRRILPLAVLPFLAAGCVEADVRASLKADGSGTMGTSVKFTEGMVKIIRTLEAKKKSSDNPADELKKTSFKMPDDARKAELAKGGLRIVSLEMKDTATELGMNASFGFDRIGSLELVDTLERMDGTTKTSSSGAPLHLTRDAEGIYTLRLSMKNDEEDEDGEGGIEIEEVEDDDMDGAEAEGEGEEPEDPAEAMQLMGEMMNEAANMKITFALSVPGTVVDFSPAAGGAKEEGGVTWTLDMGTMMAVQMEGATEDGGMAFQVRFRMPEGQSLPAAALYSGPAPKEEKPAEKSPAPPAPEKSRDE